MGRHWVLEVRPRTGGAGFHPARTRWKPVPPNSAGHLPARFLPILVLLGQAAVLAWGVVEWNAAGRLSDQVSREIQREASDLPEGSLLVLGAAPSGDDPRLWVWHWGLSLPFAVQPPFMPPEVERRVSVIARPELACCGFQRWYEGTRQAITAWSARPGRPPAVLLAWELPSDELVRRAGPQLEGQVQGLLQADSAGSMAGGLDALLRPMGGTAARFRFK